MDKQALNHIIHMDVVEAVTYDFEKVYIYISSEKNFNAVFKSDVKYVIVMDERFEKCYVLTYDFQVQGMIVRVFSSFIHELNKIVFEHIPKSTSTTSLWHQLKNHQVVYDPKSSYKKLALRYKKDYPLRLKLRIIEKQLTLFEDVFYDNIKKACMNQDIIRFHTYLLPLLQGLLEIYYAKSLETYDSFESGLRNLNMASRESDRKLYQMMTTLMQTSSWKKRVQILEWINEVIYQ